VRGVFWGAWTAREPAQFKAEVAQLFDMVKAGKIRPRVSARYPLAKGGEAIALLENRLAVGKVVVTMD
jgi:NADPH:quinone reductase-like Zn-dependent oxidoreductase